MEWSSKLSWEVEDQEYQAKRKVDNKQSFYHRHMMGSYPSYTMGRKMRYESNNEKLFFFLLDLDPEVIRFYEQPVEIPVRYLKGNGVISKGVHVPDILIFREGSVPWLVQVKEPDPALQEDIPFLKLQEICQEFAHSKGWKYSVVFPKDLPNQLQRNIKFLVNFLHLNNGPDDLINRLTSYLEFRGSTSIVQLSELYQLEYRSHQVKPVIFHMIAKGILSTDLSMPITSLSMVKLRGGRETEITKYLEKGMSTIENI